MTGGDETSEANWEFPPPTREQRIQMHYLAIAGRFPGPNVAALAAMLAHRLVELEDDEEPFQGGHNLD